MASLLLLRRQALRPVICLPPRLFSAQATPPPTPALLVKALREKTDAPILDCKKALEHANNDLDKAVEWLAARSQKVAASKASRATKQGLVALASAPDNSAACLVEVNCETDFVARNADFQAVVAQIAASTLAGQEPPAHLVSDLVGKFRENIVLGKRHVLRAAPGGVVGSYLHGKLGPGVGTMAALVSLSPGPLQLASQLAVHVVGANPPYLSREQVPAEERAQEEAKIRAHEAGKPANVQAKIVQGKMQKYFADRCLADQVFVVGELEGSTVAASLKGATIGGFVRMQLGAANAR